MSAWKSILRPTAPGVCGLCLTGVVHVAHSGRLLREEDLGPRQALQRLVATLPGHDDTGAHGQHAGPPVETVRTVITSTSPVTVSAGFGWSTPPGRPDYPSVRYFAPFHSIIT